MNSKRTDEDVSDFGELLDQSCYQAKTIGKVVLPVDKRKNNLLTHGLYTCPLLVLTDGRLGEPLLVLTDGRLGDGRSNLDKNEFWSFAYGFDGRGEAPLGLETESRFYELGKAFREKALTEGW